MFFKNIKISKTNYAYFFIEKIYNAILKQPVFKTELKISELS